MKKYFNFWKISKYSMFYLTLAINLFSILALSLFNYFTFYSNSKETYRESFISYSRDVTELAFRNIDQQIIEPIYNIPKIYFSQIRQNAAVLAPQSENLEGNAEGIRELIQSLRPIQIANPGIRSLDIYYENTGTVVTGFSNVHFPKSQEELERYLPWYQEFQAQDASLYFMAQSENAYPLDEPVITYVHRISLPKWNGKDILAAIHIPVSVFANYIDETKGKLEILASDGRLLYASSEEEGQQKIVFSYDSTATSLHYTYSMADRFFYEDYNSNTKILLMNFLLSIVFNVALLLGISYYSSHIYQEKIRSLSEGAGVTLKPEAKNFDSSLRQLKEEILSLHDTAKSSEALRFQRAVRSLILSRKQEESVSALEPYLNYDSVCICIIQKMEGDVEQENLEPIQMQLRVWEKDVRCHVLLATMQKGEAAAVVNFQKNEEGEILAQVMERLRLYFGACRLVMGKSTVSEKEAIKRAYRSAQETARYGFIFCGRDVLYEEDIHAEKRKGHGSHLKLFENMEKDINNENLLEFKLHLEMLITSFKEGNYTIDYCFSTLRDLVTLVYQMMQHRKLDMWIMYGYDIREYYKQIPDIDAFQRWMSDVCEILLKNILQRRKAVDEDGDLKLKLTQLINENLENDISLDFLCDQLSMRMDVLSRTFKQVMGEGYTEYVKKKKLERAIRLMEEDYSMKEIAQRLGYSSAQYFIKVFKEFYGTTPYQYKKAKQAEKEK